MDKIRIGFIGAGGIARAHVRRLGDVPEAQVVAMTEPSPESRERMIEAHPDTASCAFYDDYREMLEKEALDAVEIHTPHTLHFQQAMDVLDLGLPLLIEKPMVTTTEHAHRLIEAAQGKIVGISYQRHYQPTYRYVKQQIEGGALGKSLTTLGPQRTKFHSLTVYGTRKTFVNDMPDAKLFDGDAPENEHVVTTPYPGMEKGDLIPDFIAAIREDREPPVGTRDVFRVMDICMAARESAETGRTVKVGYLI